MSPHSRKPETSMTSEPVTFLWAELEAFRGFRDRSRVDLDASAVILAGPNGTGKTSFFDALQWLLLGSLERLEPWRTRRNTEHIVSAFRPDDSAIVAAAVRFGDEVVELRRQGRHDSGFLEWSDRHGIARGDDAEQRLAAALSPRDRDHASLRRLLMTSALLQQDVVRAVLEDKAADRYQQLASLLGLEALGAFELATRRRADRLSEAGKNARGELTTVEAQRRAASERVDALRRQQAEAPDTASTRAEIAARVATDTSVVTMRRELPSNASDAALFQSAVAATGDELSRTQQRLFEVVAQARDVAAVSDDELAPGHRAADAAKKGIEEARVRLKEAEAELAEARQRSEALASLAHAALPLLTDRCPVCEQEIDKGHVERHLEDLLKEGGADLPARQRARDEALSAMEAAEAHGRETTAALAHLGRRRELLDQLAAEREQLRTDVLALVARADQEGLAFERADELIALDSDALTSAIEDLRTVWRLVSDLTAVLRALPAGEQIATAERELGRLEALVAAARERTTTASRREEEGKTLQRAATRAVAAVTESRFRLLAPLVSDIFSRLDPHPVFKELDFTLGVYRERGEASPIVRDSELGIEADPLLVFSSSQTNVAALSYFLALGWAAGQEAMPFVLLDDPLQSLDDVNALGFADLCRHIRQQRQLIVSTHDPRLASLLERKLAPRAVGEKTRVVDFHAWTRNGHELEERLVPQQLSEGEARMLLAAQVA
jgi:DNA repair exonuclease SbcCD ATPase subunit